MKIVLLNSGGKDTLATAMLLRDKHEMHSLHVQFVSPSPAAAAVAKEIAARYCASHHEVTTSGLYMGREVGKVDGLLYQALGLVGLGAMYASQIGASGIAAGFYLAGHIFGPSFGEGVQKVLDSYGRGLQFLTPLAGTPSVMEGSGETLVLDIVKADPLWKRTVYCHKDPACTKCAKCLQRAAWLKET